MNARRDVFELSEQAARARLSRTIRDSEAGWLFYSPGGTAYHLLSNEAEALERRGVRLILKFNRMAKKLARLPWLTFKLAIAEFVISMVLAFMFGSAFLDPIGNFMARYVFPSLILFSLFFGFLRPFIMLGVRAIGMTHWQWREAEKLRRLGRGSVPAPIEKKHLRYNLFRIIFYSAMMLLLARFVMVWLMTPSQFSEHSFAIDIICIGIMVFCSVPAGLIDATHIRRKWFD